MAIFHRQVWAGLAIVVLIAGCRSVSTGTDAHTVVPVVRTALVYSGELVAPPLRFSGIVRASQRATLTFQVSGTLQERQVELGQLVQAGERLGRVYNPGLEPARDSARARLEELATQLQQAQREWERSRRLRERGVVSEQTLEQLAARRDALKASVATARAALSEAERLLAESYLIAPFAGRVEALLVERGEFVGAGQPVMRLSSPAGREVEIRVPAHLLGHVSVGQQLPIWTVHDRSRAAVTGTLMEIAQAGSVRGELHPLLIRLPAEQLTSGTPVEVGITPRIAAAKTVPLLALMKRPEGTAVLRVTDGLVESVPVTVQRMLGERVVVAAEALQGGDQVIYAGLTRVVAGDRVEVLR
ncbi:efflux RND transporter periplasmic adaptor subunit [Marinobacter sp. X15-166B]|uniref:efflux RND transporter periplasmic adaptor subunit n=1 Tax=Marinobacter sp. X15-166B TaxID=1897620 RepID=UPI00085BDB49|nr:efflux RND transporter periplasmic adaptor subunit [Marinobacter sp. X15-166B]OEY65587.1 efflux transporter periplasmic adaptor subunit [Marinobacter sp. X15-166B]